MDKKSYVIIVLLIIIVILSISMSIDNCKDIRDGKDHFVNSLRTCLDEKENLENIDCTNSSDCILGKFGYPTIYDWMDRWAKNCERENKIFTIDKRESGTFLDPRCTIEQKDGSGVLP